MNKILIVTAMLAFFLMASYGSATKQNVTIYMNYSNNGTLSDTNFDTSTPASDGGASTLLRIGNITNTKNDTALFKFNSNTSYIPIIIANSKLYNVTVLSATFYIYEPSPSGTGTINFSVWGINNQSWLDSGVGAIVLNDFLSSSWSASNQTFVTYNDTWNSALSGWWSANITKWMQYSYIQAYKNTTIYVNMSDKYYQLGSGLLSFDSMKNADIPHRWYVSVTYEIPTYISIESPTNTTYYNNYTLPLKISNQSFNYDTCFYSWNNGFNQTFTPNTTVEIPVGNNYLWVYCNDSTNNWYSNNVNFATNLVCNSTYNNLSVCTGESSLFTTPCALENGQWQFSNSNITRCDGMCHNGVCIRLPVVCTNQCNVSADQTSCGGANNKYTINCTYDSNGCSIWNPLNLTYCRYGCFNGICLNCTNECKIGETKCIGEYTYNCVQDLNCTKWDLTNGTFCAYGCFKNYSATSNMQFDYCNYHSFNDTYAISKGIYVIGKSFEIIFPKTDMRSRSFIFLILAIVAALVTMYYTRAWVIGLIVAIGILWLGAFAGWFDWFQLIIFTLIVGFIIWFATKGNIQGGEE